MFPFCMKFGDPFVLKIQQIYRALVFPRGLFIKGNKAQEGGMNSDVRKIQKGFWARGDLLCYVETTRMEDGLGSTDD